MEFTLLLRELWSRKWLVAVGVLVAVVAALFSAYRISLTPPKLESRTLSYASARTQVMVDSRDSSLADLGRDTTPLVARAAVYARMMTSPAALELIGRDARIDPRLIYAQGPVEANQPREAQEPTAEVRSNQLVGEADQYRLRYENSAELPLITIYSQAPTVDGANRLADGAVQGLKAYVADVEQQHPVKERRQVDIRQLGAPFGETVNQGIGTKLALLVFVVTLILWCAAILIVGRLVRSWKATGKNAVPDHAPLLIRPDEIRANGHGEHSVGPHGHRSIARGWRTKRPHVR